MTAYKITAEFEGKGPFVLTEKRPTPKSRVGRERQMKNVVAKFEEYFQGYGCTRLEVECVN